MNKGIDPYQQAYEEIPQAWYELDYKKHLALTFLSAFILHNLNREIFQIDNLGAHLAGVAVFSVSSIADRYSTFLGMKANCLAAENGINTYRREKNILISDIKHPKEFLLSKRALAIDITTIALSAFYPDIGAGWAIGRGQAVANNLRVARRINRAVEIQKAMNS